MHSIHGSVKPSFDKRKSYSIQQRPHSPNLYDDQSARMSVKDGDNGSDDESLDELDIANVDDHTEPDGTVIVINNNNEDTVDALFKMGTSWKNGIANSYGSRDSHRMISLNDDHPSSNLDVGSITEPEVNDIGGAGIQSLKTAHSTDLTNLRSLASGNTQHSVRFNEKNGDIFEDAIANEIKIELTQQIRQELMEDFELKLAQKEIENRLKLNKQKEEIEAEKREIISNYETLVSKIENEKREIEQDMTTMMNENRKELNTTHSEAMKELNNVYSHNTNTFVYDNRYGLDNNDINDDYKLSERIDDRPSINWSESNSKKELKNRATQHRKKKINNNNEKELKYHDMEVYAKLEKLFNSSTLLWSFPLIK